MEILISIPWREVEKRNSPHPGDGIFKGSEKPILLNVNCLSINTYTGPEIPVFRRCVVGMIEQFQS